MAFLGEEISQWDGLGVVIQHEAFSTGIYDSFSCGSNVLASDVKPPRRCRIIAGSFDLNGPDVLGGMLKNQVDFRARIGTIKTCLYRRRKNPKDVLNDEPFPAPAGNGMAQ